MKHLSNKKLVDMINYRYSNELNDDDYIAELCRRRKGRKNEGGKMSNIESLNKLVNKMSEKEQQIKDIQSGKAIVSGEEFIMVKEEK